MCWSRRVFPAAIYLALLVTSALWDNSESLCPEGGPEEAGELTYELRQTACNLNLTAALQFHSQIRAKHGAGDDAPGHFVFAKFFQHRPTKAWCRHVCPNVTAENITWCVNIVNFDHDIETCISPSGANSSCGAQLVGLEKFLSLPEDCSYAGDVGCLGLTDLDWYFKNAYLTCTVHTDTCYEKYFTFFNILPFTVREPVIDVFPESPMKVTPGDTIVLHAEVTSTTDRNHVTWRHGNITYRWYIREDPFCNPAVENCPTDTHHNATDLRRQRVRMYFYPRLVKLTGCQNILLYRIESYLIINNTNASDGGEYVFSSTSAFSTGFETVERNVTIIVECEDSPLPMASCDHNHSISLNMGHSVSWSCQLRAAQNTTMTLMLNGSPLPPSLLGESCDKTLSVSFHVEEMVDHLCYSTYTVSVHICAANSSMEGEYVVAVGEEVLEETKFLLKMTDPTTGKGDNSSTVSVVAYAVPVAVLILVVLSFVVVLLVLLRKRKRRRQHT